MTTIMTHLSNLALAVALGLLVVALARVRARTGATGLRVGAGHGRSRTIWLPRARHGLGGLLPAPLVRVARALGLDDGRTPCGPTLTMEQVATRGLPGLRWRLLHAGLAGAHGVPWFRLRQAEAVAAFVLMAAAVLLALRLPLYWLVPLSPACAVLGYLLSLEMLRRLTARRQDRLRVELVRTLYGLAIFVAAGRPIDRALDRLAVRPGELAHELFLARQRQARGMDMNASLRVMAARCGGEEMREAISLIIAARGDAVALDRVPGMLRALAESVRARIRARRRAEVARAMLRATAYGTLCGLPVIGTTVLYPALRAVLHAVAP